MPLTDVNFKLFRQPISNHNSCFVLRNMTVMGVARHDTELTKYNQLITKSDSQISYFVISVKYYNDQITTLTDMYCLYKLDVIIPGATIKPQSQKSVHNMTTSVDDTEPFDYTTVDVPAVKTSRQDGVGVTWDKPHKDENIDSVSSWLMLIIALTAKSVFTQTLQLT